VAERAQVAGAVERMQIGLNQGRGVAEVVQVDGRNQLVPFVGREDGGHPLCLPGDPLHVGPAVTERRQQCLGVVRGPIVGHAGNNSALAAARSLP
jgi:hypothetical protein